VATSYAEKPSGRKIIDELDETRYSIVLAPQKGKLMAAINDAIGNMKRDGSLDAIVPK
jgi:hypothetical protein